MHSIIACRFVRVTDVHIVLLYEFNGGVRILTGSVEIAVTAHVQ